MERSDKQQERFGVIYRAHLSEIGAYAARRATPSNAVDVVAETFMVAWRRFDEMPPEPAARAWLYGVARRVLANQRRGDLRRSSLHDRLVDAWVVGSPVDVDRGSDLDALRQALAELSEADREIVLFAGVEELTSAEIAVVLDVSVEVARNRLSRARARLRDRLDSQEIRIEPSGHSIDRTEGGQP